MERCALCGASLGAGDRFCGDCGAPVGFCPSSGEPATPGKRFCRSCGAALTGMAAAPDGGAWVPGPAPVAERRVCSVLFSDMAGFTPLSDSRDPEARAIATGLRCRPLLDRAADLVPAGLRAEA